MALFVETKGRVGTFTVVKAETFEDPITKRKTTKPALRLNTVWTGDSPGFLSTNSLSPYVQNQARAIWGEAWREKLDQEIRLIGKSNGLQEVEPTKEAMDAFQVSQTPVDPQATGARDIGSKRVSAQSQRIKPNLIPVSEKSETLGDEVRAAKGK